jgi:hypothetical protein
VCISALLAIEFALSLLLLESPELNAKNENVPTNTVEPKNFK